MTAVRDFASASDGQTVVYSLADIDVVQTADVVQIEGAGQIAGCQPAAAGGVKIAGAARTAVRDVVLVGVVRTAVCDFASAGDGQTVVYSLADVDVVQIADVVPIEGAGRIADCQLVVADVVRTADRDSETVVAAVVPVFLTDWLSCVHELEVWCPILSRSAAGLRRRRKVRYRSRQLE